MRRGRLRDRADASPPPRARRGPQCDPRGLGGSGLVTGAGIVGGAVFLGVGLSAWVALGRYERLGSRRRARGLGRLTLGMDAATAVALSIVCAGGAPAALSMLLPLVSMEVVLKLGREAVPLALGGTAAAVAGWASLRMLALDATPQPGRAGATVLAVVLLCLAGLALRREMECRARAFQSAASLRAAFSALFKEELVLAALAPGAAEVSELMEQFEQACECPGLAPALAKRVVSLLSLGPSGQLSPREREVMDLLTLGHSDREVAQLLYVSPATVRRHVANVVHKVGAVSRADAIARLGEGPGGAAGAWPEPALHGPPAGSNNELEPTGRRTGPPPSRGRALARG